MRHNRLIDSLIVVLVFALGIYLGFITGLIASSNPDSMTCNPKTQELIYDNRSGLATCEQRLVIPENISAIEISEADYQDGKIPNLSGTQRLNVKMNGQDARETKLNMEQRCLSYSGQLIDDVCYQARH